MSDIVNHPPHYKGNGIEAIDVIESFGLDQSFALGNAVKYLLRAGRKGEALTDLRKARWYLNRKIEQLEAGATTDVGKPLYYVATPYSKYQGGNIGAAFVAAARLMADLVTAGHNVYSPIVHSHPIAMHSGLDPLDHSLWLAVDKSMMDACDALLVAQMHGWRDSYGISEEIKYFKSERRPILYLDCATMAIMSTPDIAENTEAAPLDLSKAPSPCVEVEHRGVIR